MWQIGTPITGYYHGPGGGTDRWGPLTHGMAEKLVDGGFNLAWGRTVEDLDIAHEHGLRVDLIGLYTTDPLVLDDPAAKSRMDSVIDSVKDHPALYSYNVSDEPSALKFPEFSRLLDYFRERDPDHLAYINLFPTYASAEALGTEGDTTEAYGEHLRQYIQIVRPDLISYDHYQLRADRDDDEYFLNLRLVREASLSAGVPSSTSYRPVHWGRPIGSPPATRAGTWPTPLWPTAVRAFRSSSTGSASRISSAEVFPNTPTVHSTLNARLPMPRRH